MSQPGAAGMRERQKVLLWLGIFSGLFYCAFVFAMLVNTGSVASAEILAAVGIVYALAWFTGYRTVGRIAKRMMDRKSHLASRGEMRSQPESEAESEES